MAEEAKATEPAEAPAEGAAEEAAGGQSKFAFLAKLLSPKVLIALAAVLGGAAGAGTILLFSGGASAPPPAEQPAPPADAHADAPAAAGHAAAPPAEADKAGHGAEGEKAAMKENVDAVVEEGGHGDEKGAKSGEPVFFKFEPFVVNVFEKNSIHYLKMQLVVECASEATVEELKFLTPQLRDTLLFIVSDMTMREILTPGGKALLKEDIIATFNNWLKSGKISKVYFTEFTIQ